MTKIHNPVNDAFGVALSQLRDGDAMTEASDHLQSLIHAIKETGGKGAVHVMLRLKPGKGAEMILEDDIRVYLPRAEKPGTVLYATKDCRLQREDPNQRTLDLQPVEKAEAV